MRMNKTKENFEMVQVLHSLISGDEKRGIKAELRIIVTLCSDQRIVSAYVRITQWKLIDKLRHLTGRRKFHLAWRHRADEMIPHCTAGPLFQPQVICHCKGSRWNFNGNTVWYIGERKLRKCSVDALVMYHKTSRWQVTRGAESKNQGTCVLPTRLIRG
jgi:hypothetical protein